jgi:hypothetical protein
LIANQYEKIANIVKIVKMIFSFFALEKMREIERIDWESIPLEAEYIKIYEYFLTNTRLIESVLTQ